MHVYLLKINNLREKNAQTRNYMCMCVYSNFSKFRTRELSQLSAYRMLIAGNSCAVHRKRLACPSPIQRASVTKLGRVRESRRKSGKIACTQDSSGGSGPRTAVLGFVPHFKVPNEANVISENCLTLADHKSPFLSTRPARQFACDWFPLRNDLDILTKK